MSMTLIQRAYVYAVEKHRGQFRKDLKTPFIRHPIGVAKIIRVILPNDENLIASAYLHDVIEETNTSYGDLEKEFNKDIADLVMEVTKDGYNHFPRLETRRGIILKFADRLQNLSDMESMDEEWQKKYIEKSKFWE